MRRARHLRRSAGAGWWLTALAVMVLIWLGSARPDGARAAIGILRGIIVGNSASAAKWPSLGFAIQKAGHFLEYLLLAATLLRALRATHVSHRGAAIIALMLAVTYAVLDEWHQSFVPGREPALRDVLIDAAGALAAIAVSNAHPLLRRNASR